MESDSKKISPEIRKVAAQILGNIGKSPYEIHIMLEEWEQSDNDVLVIYDSSKEDKPPEQLKLN